VTEHASLTAEPAHPTWDRSLTPRLGIVPGDQVDIGCVNRVSVALSKQIPPDRELFPAQ
jgi:hypothetical protein